MSLVSVVGEPSRRNMFSSAGFTVLILLLVVVFFFAVCGDALFDDPDEVNDLLRYYPGN